MRTSAGSQENREQDAWSDVIKFLTDLSVLSPSRNRDHRVFHHSSIDELEDDVHVLSSIRRNERTADELVNSVLKSMRRAT